jgi:hypothetical protein
MNIDSDMPSLSPDPSFEYFFKACRKGDSTTKAITVGDSAVRALADTSKITGLLGGMRSWRGSGSRLR